MIPRGLKMEIDAHGEELAENGEARVTFGASLSRYREGDPRRKRLGRTLVSTLGGWKNFMGVLAGA